MYSILISNSSKYKKAEGVNENIIAKINYSMNKFQSKNNRIGTYEIDKNFLSCFHGQIYILDIGIDALAFGY